MAKRTAAQAREESLKNLKGPIIQQFIEHIDHRIELAIKDGKTIIYHPFAAAGGYPKYKTPPTTEERDATFQHFINEGYTVKYYPDPDPGHPASSDYYTIEW